MYMVVCCQSSGSRSQETFWLADITIFLFSSCMMERSNEYPCFTAMSINVGVFGYQL